MNPVQSVIGAVALCLALLVASGCSGGTKKVTVNGKVMRGAQALKVSAKGKIEVIFHPYPEFKETGKISNPDRARTYPAMVQNDGNFEVEEIPVGQYLISVRLIDPMPVNDLLEGKFSEQNSKIIRDVKEGERIDIDLNAVK